MDILQESNYRDAWLWTHTSICLNTCLCQSNLSLCPCSLLWIHPANIFLMAECSLCDMCICFPENIMNLGNFRQSKGMFCKFSSFLTALLEGRDQWVPSLGQSVLFANSKASEAPVTAQQKCWFLQRIAR